LDLDAEDFKNKNMRVRPASRYSTREELPYSMSHVYNSLSNVEHEETEQGAI
jgi:hypothetical protein